jgi:hypothetical protein
MVEPREAAAATPDSPLRWIGSAEAIRGRCAMVFAAAERNELAHFTLDAGRLEHAADYVLDTMRANYPTLAIPYHSRWRHFAAGGRDRWADWAATHPLATEERARLRFELAITSVLLDAGAGERWTYRETDGGTAGRSEGLAIASFDLFMQGGFATDARSPRADGEGLAGFTSAALARAFQVTADNPLQGLEGRTILLRALGDVVLARPDVFAGPTPRLGALSDHLAGQARNGRLPASAILSALTDVFAPIWPGRLSLFGQPLGDVWRHPAAVTNPDDPTSGLVPFHKLSQWLAYSLVEPLEEAGIAVDDLDALTGLPEYRNGGLLIDLGVLGLCDPHAAERPHRPGDELVVEWRALTVMLLDRIAGLIRQRLGLDATALPLARVLEGGTWAAGRRIARERRAGGGPPLAIESDGTVF